MSMMEKGVLMIVLGLVGLIYILPLMWGIYMERQDRRKRGEPDSTRARYDERQKLIRLNASKHALYVLAGHLLAVHGLGEPMWFAGRYSGRSTAAAGRRLAARGADIGDGGD